MKFNHDKKIAKMLKGKATPASGAVQGFVGDVIFDDWIIENKYSTKFVRLSTKYFLEFFLKAKAKRSKGAILIEIPEGIFVIIEHQICQKCVSVEGKTIKFDNKFLENNKCFRINQKAFKVLTFEKFKNSLT